MYPTDEKAVSLSEVHRSVNIPKDVGFIRRLLAFVGPAYLVSVGYMDPGNWATDIEGGSRFGYQLVWVLLLSNLMAVLLQTLAARLGIVTGRDLAQACRDYYPRPVTFILWILGEIAIAACDLAEVLGTAIGLNLLFHLPLIYGVIITGFDTLLFLVIQHFGIRKMEAFIILFIATIGVCFIIQVFMAEPEWGRVMAGFVPHLTPASLYVAVGIIGATVMPHNLYLHSALVQTRNVDQSAAGKRSACRYNLIDTAVALNGAFFVNAAILIVAAAVFFKNGVIVTEIQQAHSLLTSLLGTTVASTLFAVALISAGQSSTLTGTLAGQIVMEGFIRFKMRPVMRRLVTRLLAIIPAVIVIAIQGEKGSYGLLILSQVVLSLQLPFAVIPLIKLTSDRALMASFVNRHWVQWLAWLAAAVIVALNANLILQQMSDWISSAGSGAIWIWLTVVPVVVAVAVLLVYITLPKGWREGRKLAIPAPQVRLGFESEKYKHVGVAVDFGFMDRKVLSHAVTLARQHDATIHLFHVVEGVSGQVFGQEAFDDEARRDREKLEGIAEQVRAVGLRAESTLGFGRVTSELVRLAREQNLDILVMGGHGHRGLQDLLLGTSVSEVRHHLSIPVLVVQ